jgi:DnaJ-class molecular chaperone
MNQLPKSHPDKVVEAEKEVAEKKFVDISKAYKVYVVLIYK